MLPDFLPNNYTREVGFHAAAMVHNEFTFTYRPFGGPSGGAAFAGAIGREGLEKGKLFEVIRDRLMKWSFERDIDDGALDALNGVIFDKIQGVIFGTRAPDFEVTPQ
jgi:hypothetical protein